MRLTGLLGAIGALAALAAAEPAVLQTAGDDAGSSEAPAVQSAPSLGEPEVGSLVPEPYGVQTASAEDFGEAGPYQGRPTIVIGGGSSGSPVIQTPQPSGTGIFLPPDWGFGASACKALCTACKPYICEAAPTYPPHTQTVT
jgi:hypothetical protein